MRAYDLNDELLPDVDDAEAAEMVKIGRAAWIRKGKVIRYATDDNLDDLRKDSCSFCGTDQDLVVHGKATSSKKISAADFDTVCRECRQKHRWLNRQQFDKHVCEQFSILGEFALRYPNSCMALVRTFSGGKDIIGYATLQQVAESIVSMEGHIVSSLAKNSYHFEYYGPPPDREQYVKWVRDWMYNHFEGQCYFCRCTLRRHEDTLDHIVPLTRKGSNSATNLAVACKWCNEDKGTMNGDEYLAYLDRRRRYGKRIGVQVPVMGDRCVEYQRCVSHRPEGFNRINPIIEGDVVFDRDCGQEEFETRYCCRCLNDRCSRMAYSEESPNGVHGPAQGHDSGGVTGTTPHEDGSMVSDIVGDEQQTKIGGGASLQDQDISPDGSDHMEKLRRARRRAKRHGKPKGH